MVANVDVFLRTGANFPQVPTGYVYGRFGIFLICMRLIFVLGFFSCHDIHEKCYDVFVYMHIAISYWIFSCTVHKLYSTSLIQ